MSRESRPAVPRPDTRQQRPTDSPRPRTNLNGRSPTTYLSLSDFLPQVPYQTLKEVSPSDKIRTQAGITNRYQAKMPLDADLLGRAQATKAVQVCFNESLQRILTADVPARNDVCASPTPVSSCMLHLPKCYPVSKARDSVQPVYHKKRLPEPIKPNEISCCYSRRLRDDMTPDVVLESMNTLWELHSQFFSKSERLLDLLNNSDQSEYCRNKSRGTSDICQTGGLYYCGPEDTHFESQPDNLKRCNLCNMYKDNNWSMNKTKDLKRIINLKLDVKDPLVTTEGFAVALGNLYNDEPKVEAEHILGTFAAATVLKFKTLFNKCAKVMLNNINTSTVCYFHQAAMKYNQEKLREACERWLELNLIVHLRYDATLRDLDMEVLQKILLSPRLFTFTEYHVLQTILSWVFLQVNTEIQMMPPYSTVITYFISLHKLVIYLEKEIRQKYFGLFQSIRLHGITETRQIEELQQIDLLPQATLLEVVTHNYYALQHGGDMPCAKYFPSEAIRFGFIMTEEPWYHSEMISYCGFYFELKAIQEKKGSSYSFFMQRLNHTDSNISFGITERNAFSLRQEREVKYEIQVQTQIDEEWQVFTTGYQCQKFGVTKMSCQSQILLVAGLTMPVYVTFALLFPVS
ncbi:BTB/POZ domain-containing protein 16 isoform X2 [Narcine bancroftii]|uniref:BTB/POZ domain-containing protein 16 isoform X2 n=1 Tax=Narcine bancroftii TaxID=1343680 RepID=UPI00383208F3